MIDSTQSIWRRPVGPANCAPARAAPDDAALMAAVALGDVRAFACLVDRHLPSVYRVCQRLLDDRHEAEDLTQECFARLWRTAPDWHPLGGGLPAWLQRVARNLCFDRLRRRREVPTDTIPDLIDERMDAAAKVHVEQLRAIVATCLARLAEHHRTALMLSYFEGHSNALAAQIMDMKLKAFESLLVRARRRLGEELRSAGIAREDLRTLPR